jgi:hypothetical protein
MPEKIITNGVESSLGAVNLKVARKSGINDHNAHLMAGLALQDATQRLDIGADKVQYASGRSMRSSS